MRSRTLRVPSQENDEHDRNDGHEQAEAYRQPLPDAQIRYTIHC
jgi:hypothetical protein